jgi:SAM-dependent methyltransferase
MKSIQEKSREYFAKLVLDKKDKTTVAARYSFDSGKENTILKDIIYKLDFKTGQSFLDIGCGYGYLTEYILEYLTKQDLSITLMDIPEIIDAVEQDFIKEKHKNIHLQKGLFPQDFEKELSEGYDRVLLYSVLHYSDDPLSLIEAAIKLLNPYGKLLLGDLPNISRKGRFLSSKKGREFEANYRQTTIDKLPLYENQFEFVSKMKADPNYYSLIDDNFIKNVITTYTNRGYDVYILPQPETLPMCYTREDMLICKYD